MRKLFVVIIALLYLASSSGATVHLHYCMGKLVDAGLQKEPAKTCGKCGMDKKAGKDNDCCKDEQKFVQLDEAQKAAAYHTFHLQALTDAVVAPFQPEAGLLPSALSARFPTTHAPPLQGGNPLYLRNCVFRI